MIECLKIVANRKGIGYQTMIRMWMMERLERMSEGISLPQNYFPDFSVLCAIPLSSRNFMI